MFSGIFLRRRALYNLCGCVLESEVYSTVFITMRVGLLRARVYIYSAGNIDVVEMWYFCNRCVVTPAVAL